MWLSVLGGGGWVGVVGARDYVRVEDSVLRGSVAEVTCLG